MCEVCFLYCDDVWLGVVYDFFSSSFFFLMSCMLNRNMTMLLSFG